MTLENLNFLGSNLGHKTGFSFPECWGPCKIRGFGRPEGQSSRVDVQRRVNRDDLPDAESLWERFTESFALSARGTRATVDEWNSCEAAVDLCGESSHDSLENVVEASDAGVRAGIRPGIRGG